MNVGHSHWCLCVAYIQQRRIQYYGPVDGAGDTCLNGPKCHLQGEAKGWVGDPSVPQHLLDFDSWTLVPSTGDTPQQNNCSDCGVFTCTFANYISQNLKLRFSQSNINHFRQRITYDLAYALEETGGYQMGDEGNYCIFFFTACGMLLEFPLATSLLRLLLLDLKKQ